MDERIRLAVVSCSFGTYESTWLYEKHCACGYLPGILKLADMPDLAGLIAPRHLILVAGKGHEDYQEIGGRRRPFSDIEQVQLVLRGEEA